ncbi:hypothetical protein C8035_v011605 [Colletotrichum spinosum]|uniref:Necrosis inducing protein n=1 Tax=Colletotrichum spinosum TaxID=1347390 RepID=A0A4R8Q9U5_9PEZI|nr:hypothetical protein C8035_v011605 [Colletotrichum spinosum]
MLAKRFAFCLAAVGSAASVLTPRGGDTAVGNHWTDHDKVTPLPELPDDGLLGQLEKRFSPILYAYQGCIPYAAVNSDGYAGGGLRPTGDTGGDCRDFSQTGQLYATVGKSHGRWAVLYSYYLPKVHGPAEQHRHHWLSLVVWLSITKCPAKAENAKILATSFSTAPGEFVRRIDTIFTTALGGNSSGPRTHPVVRYDGGQPLLPSPFAPEAFRFDDDPEVEVEDPPRRLAGAASGQTDPLAPPLVGWEKLPPLVKEQFNGIQYEHTKVPFSANNVQQYLDAAYADHIFSNSPIEYECQT